MNVGNRSEPYRQARDLFNKRRYAEAFSLYEELAKQGDPRCQLFLGWLYHKGLGVPRNSEKSLEWFKRAATLGLKEGAFFCGRSAALDSRYDEAAQWFRQAAQQDYSPAWLWLGLLHIKGWGTPVDKSKGVECLKKAAGGGNLLAKRELALLMSKGALGLVRVPLGLAQLVYAVVAGVVVAIRDPYSHRITG